MLTIGRTWEQRSTDSVVARAQSSFSRTRILIAAVSESVLLILMGAIWIWFRHLPFKIGHIQDIAMGLGTSGMLATLNYGLLRVSPRIAFMHPIPKLCIEVFRPLFRYLRPLELAIIATIVGIGEEVFFRGVVQQEIGLIPAAVLFGIAHVRTRKALVLGPWAALMGLVFGWLAQITGGLAAPITAHVFYDAAAMFYMRWSARLAVLPRAPEGGST